LGLNRERQRRVLRRHNKVGVSLACQVGSETKSSFLYNVYKNQPCTKWKEEGSSSSSGGLSHWQIPCYKMPIRHTMAPINSSNAPRSKNCLEADVDVAVGVRGHDNIFRRSNKCGQHKQNWPRVSKDSRRGVWLPTCRSVQIGTEAEQSSMSYVARDLIVVGGARSSPRVALIV
jgi:hypothetical protein